ncbi:LysM domain/BON superfamily protein [Shimia sp. SK013]|uniref:LysM peptidoglycan-binding domain-containing protein n=1 Tax=Shimia sp. SK013 TaxID=1389006 RepID=UPI0006B61AF6|nr:LysM peptidoglycan-binding domain-containing protein [Shimia sp. SK013]KPA22281.1 LysM domain/BON superfamily protein [Shimia sp. SK013]
MSKIATFISSNAALVGGGVAATAVAVVALVASGVLTGPEEAAPVPQDATVAAPKTAEASPPIAEVEEDTAEPAATPAPAMQETPQEEVATSEPEEEAAEVDPVPEEVVSATPPEPAPEQPSVEPVILPAFDLVRIAPDGEGQIAGTAAPNAQIILLLDGVEIAKSGTDNAGKFFTFISLGPNPQPRELLLVERRADGDLMSESSFLVAPIAAPVVVAEAPKPEAEPKPAEPVETAEAEPVDAAPVTTAAPVTQAPAETASDTTVATAQDVVQTAEEETAEAPQSETPKAPAVLVSDADGVRVVQPATSSDEAEVTSAVSIDAISYSDNGAVIVAGRGLAKSFVRLYLNNASIETAPVDEAGQWRAELLEIDAGLYTLRADEVDASGKVLSRVETPFKRETPKRVAEARQLAQAADTPQSEPATPAAEPAEPAADAAQVAAAEPAPVEQTQPEVAAAVEAGAETTSEAASQPVVESQPEVTPEQPAPAPTTASQPAVTPKKPAVQIITVQPGSSLWAIARERYGEGPMYVRVFEANKDKIRDPDLIYPGQVFTVPE